MFTADSQDIYSFYRSTFIAERLMSAAAHPLRPLFTKGTHV